MKTSNLILSLIVATLGLATVTALAAENEFTHSFIANAAYLEVNRGERVFSMGDSAAVVTNRLREPDAKLSQSVWLYRYFPAAGNRDTRLHRCDNLIVAFGPAQKPHDQKVIAIVMANAKGLEKIEKGLQQNPRYLEDLLTGY